MIINGNSIINVQGYGEIVENQTLPLLKRTWSSKELSTVCSRTGKYINTEQFQPVLYNPEERIPKYNPTWEVWSKQDNLNKGDLISVNYPQYYKKYVEVQIGRIIHGYTVGGTYITGENYFWLNFWPIIAKGGRKGIINPRFFAFQKDLFFDKLQEARDTNKMYMAVKMRQAGFTDMSACCLARAMLFIHDCSCASIAGLWDDASVSVKKMKTGISNLQKTAPFLYAQANIDTTTPGAGIVYSLEYRDKNTKNFEGPRTNMYQFSNQGSTGAEASTGKSYAIALFDEIGKNDKWVNGVEKTIPAMKEYEQFNGNLIMAFGTGGDMTEALTVTQDVFINPDINNFVSIDNEFKEIGFDADRTAVFVPGYHYYVTDYDGNTYKEESVIMIKRDIEALSKIKTRRGLDKLRNYLISRPLKISDVFTSNGHGLFDKELLTIQNNKLVEQGIDKIEHRGRFDWKHEKGRIVGVRWTPCEDELDELDEQGDLKYPFLILEHPNLRQGWNHTYIDDQERIISYACGTDPYDADSNEKGSLGSFMIRKTGKNARFVARCTWRPKDKTKFYEQTAMGTYYYNAQNLIERHNSVIFGHYKERDYHYLLARRLRIENSAIVMETFDTYYGVDMKIEMKLQGENLLRDEIILNSSLFNDFHANKAFIKYRRTVAGKKFNCDITMSAIIALLHEMQITSDIEKAKEYANHNSDMSLFSGGIIKVGGQLKRL